MPKSYKNEPGVMLADPDENGFISILPEALAKLQAERARAIARIAVLEASSQQHEGSNPDGSYTLSFTIDPISTATLRGWHEQFEMTFDEYLRYELTRALDSAVINGG